MNAAEMTNGTRVRLNRRIDTGIIDVAAGLVGTVVQIVPYSEGPVIHVLLDDAHPDLGDWDNCVQVDAIGDYSPGDVPTPECFDPA